MRRSLGGAMSLTLIAAALVACGSETRARAALEDLPALRAVEVARLPETPTDITVVGEHLLVAGRRGRVFQLSLDRPGPSGAAHATPPVVLDLRADTSVEGERGLLALETLDDSLVAMSRTRLDGTIVVDLAELGAEGRLTVTERPPVLEIEHPATYHNGGALVAHDGALLVSIGDDYDRGGDPGSAHEPPPFGTIIRIPPDRLDPGFSGGPYQPSDDDYLATGLRNPWRMALDRETGSLWISDVGEASMEEVDVLPLDGRTRVDFGWPSYEGTEVFHEGSVPDGLEPPVFTRRHGDGVCAIIGGFVYRGGPVTGLEGAYVYGDFCSTDIRAVVIEDGEVVGDRAIAQVSEPPVSITQGPGGSVLVLGAYGGIFEVEEGAQPAVTATEIDEELACRVQHSFRALERVATMDAATLARDVEAARDAAADVLATDAPELRRAATEVLSGFERAVREGADLGWDPGAVVSTVLPVLTSGEGEHAYFELALTELLERLAAPC